MGFAARHAADGLAGDADAFGTGAAILVGDLALVWSDELLGCSGLSPARSARARAVWDTCAPRSWAASTSTCCGPPAGCPARTAR